MSTDQVLVYRDERLAAYGFGDGHPFGPDRHDVFHAELDRQELTPQVRLMSAVDADVADLELFHTPEHIRFVREACAAGEGYLDGGDTPALPGLFESACTVVGSALDAMERLLAGEACRAFVPIAGLHHARRHASAGFCVFNDCGVVIETLRRRHGVQRVAYVDIDAHHGDGVFYSFESDPDLIFADIHEDGRFLYPGTGAATETGTGAAVGTKLNVPLAAADGDPEFLEGWERVEAFLAEAEPEFVLLQCGADSLRDDPITHLRLSADAHYHAARRLAALADSSAGGRLLAVGGGGYNRRNVAQGWCAVVRALVDSGS